MSFAVITQLSQERQPKAQKTMVKESLTRAFNELHLGKINHDARKLFAE
jgi:hypothetical protein